MKVLVVTNMFPTEHQPWFGSFVADQVEDLRMLGFDMRVIHFNGVQDRLNYLRAIRQVRSTVARDEVDLVHAHYGLTGAIALAQRRVPVVTTLHGSDYTGEVSWHSYVSWVVVRRSTPIFVSVEGARLLHCSRGAIIPVGVDTELFTPRERAEARRALGWAINRRYVLFPGARRDPGKRADLFDAALREARRHAPGLEGVSLDGFSRREVALAMNASDVMLMTSDREGSPLTVKESLACMTPVVSVAVGDVPELVAGLPGCAIAPREPTALAQAVLIPLRPRVEWSYVTAPRSSRALAWLSGSPRCTAKWPQAPAHDRSATPGGPGGDHADAMHDRPLSISGRAGGSRGGGSARPGL